MPDYTRALLRVAAMAVILFACRRAPTPPAETPAVSGPRQTYINTVCTFQAAPADSQLNSVRMRFEWGDGDTSAWSEEARVGWNGTAKHFWTRTGTYLVSTQAQNKDGELSDWCVPCTLAVVNRAPAAPRLEGSTSDHLADSAYSFTVVTNDPDAESVSYRIAWGNGDTSNWTALAGNSTWVLLSHAWPAVGTCSLFAQARDSAGAVSEWSLPLVIIVRTPPPRLKWRFETVGRVVSSPAIGPDGAVYFGADDYYACCVNSDGSLRWKFKTADKVEVQPVITPDGTILIASSDDTLYALRPDGSLRWRLAIADRIGPAPALGTDGTIYLAAAMGWVWAIDTAGTMRWRTYTGYGFGNSPSVGPNDAVYGVSYLSDLVAFSASGAIRWRAGHGYRSAPAVDNSGNAFIGQSGFLTARAPDSSLLWQSYAMAKRPVEPVIGTDGTVYIGDAASKSLLAFTPDGSLKWYAELDAAFACPAPTILADGTLLVCLENHYVYAIDSDGRVKWRYDVGAAVESAPAVAPDGTIYFGASDGCLYALAGTSPLADSPWPKYRHDSRNSGRSGGP